MRALANEFLVFENDVKTYGTQAFMIGTRRGEKFENDVKTYGTQAILLEY